MKDVKKTKKAVGRPKSLSCQEICNLIECCSKNDVKLLRFNELSVEFKAKDPAPEEITGSGPIQIIEQDLKDALVEAEREEVEFKEEELRRMAIEDPEQYEELMANGDLTETGNGIENETESI